MKLLLFDGNINTEKLERYEEFKFCMDKYLNIDKINNFYYQYSQYEVLVENVNTLITNTSIFNDSFRLYYKNKYNLKIVYYDTDRDNKTANIYSLNDLGIKLYTFKEIHWNNPFINTIIRVLLKLPIFQKPFSINKEEINYLTFRVKQWK